jgi:hypothetical protein
MHKSVSEWFEELPQNIREKAMHNAKRYARSSLMPLIALFGGVILQKAPTFGLRYPEAIIILQLLCCCSHANIREKALANAKNPSCGQPGIPFPRILDMVVASRYKALDYAFYWNRSPEGPEYWRPIVASFDSENEENAEIVNIVNIVNEDVLAF